MHDPQLVLQDLTNFKVAVRSGSAYKPLYVKLKLMWACNLRCGMCNHWRDPYTEPMDTGTLKHLIDELVALGCQKIHITGGEPTLRPDLEELISYMVCQGIRPTMTTNGTLLTAERCKSLTEAGLHKVNVSLDSPDPGIHDRLRGSSGAWSRTIRGIQNLRNYLYRANSLRLNTVISKENYLSLTDLPELAHQLRVDRLNLIPLDRHTEDIEGLSIEEIKEFNRRVAPTIAHLGLRYKLIERRAQAFPFGDNPQAIADSSRGHHAHSYYDRHRCYAPWTHCLIDHLGQVSVCCMTTNQVIMGDLRQQSFREVWQGEAYTKLRQSHHLPQLQQCRQCDMFLAHNQAIEGGLGRSRP